MIERSACASCGHSEEAHRLEWDYVIRRLECEMIGCPCEKFNYPVRPS